jgi:hypothetical protein
MHSDKGGSAEQWTYLAEARRVMERHGKAVAARRDPPRRSSMWALL